MNTTSKKILSDILGTPTAPFHEQRVMGQVARFCLRHKLPLKQDSFGNIYIKYKKGRGSQPLVFAAHMDHPGFEVVSVKGEEVQIGVLGGLFLPQISHAKIVVPTHKGQVRGKIIGKTKKLWHSKPIYRVKLRGDVSVGDFGYLDLPSIQFKGKTIYTKSADNLAGVALLLDTLLNLKKKRAQADVTVLLTRAEEVGFIGAIFAAGEGWLKKSVPIIVLETSSATAGRVDMNGGPVIRVGDKQSGFTPKVDLWLHRVAEGIKAGGFKFQRSLLAGGRCEASFFALEGFTVGGVAFPLGNYHNKGPKTYAAEFIGVSDYENMLKYFLALSKAPRISTVVKKEKKELMKRYQEWRERWKNC